MPELAFGVEVAYDDKLAVVGKEAEELGVELVVRRGDVEGDDGDVALFGVDQDSSCILV